MPAYITQKNQRPVSFQIPPDLKGVKYRYPNKLDLRPDSEQHRKLVDMVMQRAYRSRDQVQTRHEIWSKIERDQTVYIEKDDYEKAVERQDDRKPVSLVIPTAYALTETLLTHLAGNFLSVPPYFRYEGRGPEDSIGAILLEMAIASQSIKEKHALSLIYQWKDAFKFGYGVLVPEWVVRKGRKSVMVDEFEGDPDFQGQFTKRMNVDATLFEGHKLCNVSPYRYLPDPTVAVHEPDSGEFVGWIQRTNMNSLIHGENDGQYFNVKFLRHFIGDSTGLSFLYDETESSDRHGPKPFPYEQSASHPIDVVHMYVELIPSEAGLGKKEDPEKWHLAVAGDSMLIQAEPMNLNHNRFPVSVCAPDSDGYAGLPLAKMEAIHGLQHSMSWLWNSHMTNIRKSLNNMLVVDPQIINTRTLKDPGAGKLIYTRKSMWGKASVADAIHQLKIEDITRGNIADMGVLQSMVERAVTSDQVMGILPPRGERISANEAQGARLAGLSRFEYLGMVIAFQSLHGLGDMLASQTQQFISEDVWQKATGRWAESLADEFGDYNFDPRVLIHPGDIMIDYDIAPNDPVTSNGEFVGEMVQLFQIISNNQELVQTFDSVRILKSIARRMGFKNMQDFERKRVQSQVMSPEQIAAMGEQLVPLQGAANVA